MKFVGHGGHLMF